MFLIRSKISLSRLPTSLQRICGRSVSVMTMENSYADGVADGLAKDPPHGISTKPASFNDWPNDIGVGP